MLAFKQSLLAEFVLAVLLAFLSVITVFGALIILHTNAPLNNMKGKTVNIKMLIFSLKFLWASTAI